MLTSNIRTEVESSTHQNFDFVLRHGSGPISAGERSPEILLIEAALDDVGVGTGFKCLSRAAPRF